MEKKVVSAEENKIFKKMFWNSHLVFANFNMTKMEANGFTMTMAPAVESMATISKARRPPMPAISPSSIPMQSHSTLSQVCATHWKRTATTVKFPARPLMPSRLP